MDFKVHVRPGGTAGGTGFGDHLASADDIAFFDHERRIVRIKGDVAVLVVDFDHIAEPGFPAGEFDQAIAG